VKIDNLDFNAVIFDLDGTLYCNRGFKKKLILRSIRKIRKTYLMNKVRKKMMGIDYNSEEKFLNSFFREIAGKNKKRIKKVKSWYKRDFYPLFINLLKKRFKSRENINGLLEVLKNNNIKLAVLSDYSHVKERLDALGINKSLFDVVASNEEYGVLKPHKRPLIDIAEKLNVKPENVLIVGDRDDTDGEGARMANMNYILIARNGKNHNENMYSWETFHNQIIKMSKN
jgi:HAD superfamily hydrolase (TIGR01549 family)